jgi:hypothetical protein
VAGSELILHRTISCTPVDFIDGDRTIQNNARQESKREPPQANSQGHLHKYTEANLIAKPSSDLPVHMQSETRPENKDGTKLAKLLSSIDCNARLQQD